MMAESDQKRIKRAAAGLTPFQQRVFLALRDVPAGRVTTYGALAKAIRRGSARAVGQALRRNPMAPAIPCHRVIRSDLTIGGFMGSRSLDAVKQKLARLAAEGVEFDSSGRLIRKERLWKNAAGDAPANGAAAAV